MAPPIRRDMKAIGSMLILTIAVHAQCGVQCLGADTNGVSHKIVPAAEQPPCHQHAEDPSSPDSSRHDHGSGNSCRQAQAFESRIAPLSKAAQQWDAMALVTASDSLQPLATAVILVTGTDVPSVISQPPHLSVLRI